MDSGVSLDDKIKKDYYKLSDEEIVHLAKSGDLLAEEFLIKKYKNYVRMKARSYFLVGADGEDIIQEGMIGLFKAIRDYDASKNDTFKAFADLCIKRQMITAITAATRQKHTPLNTYVSFHKIIDDQMSDRTLIDILKGDLSLDPETLYINKEENKSMKKSMDALLSDFEWEVLTGYLAGESYQEIALKLGCPFKSVDNGLRRIKRKIEKHLKSKFQEG